MNPSKASKTSEILTHPLILKAAWLRVDAWYRSAEFEPQPELSRWRLNPERMLNKLANELNENTWQPDLWNQVPYPKKGRRLRHYLMPTVRDQVAFMAHMVLLGPIFDQKIANFAFGNRWYRPIAWDRRVERSQWKLLPYPLFSDKTYLPYPRAHGLFRRVAHWTVAHMTNADLSSDEEVYESQSPNDFPNEDLPAWTRKNWWENFEGEPRAYWVALDIELAFPSVKIDHLKQAAINVLNDSREFDSQTDGYPSFVMESLKQKKVLKELVRRLTTSLDSVRINENGIPFEAWGPPEDHPLPKIHKKSYDRIPTGLAISGMLLNIVLIESDRRIQKYLNATSGSERGAFVRFSDDMYLLSRTQEGLLALIEVVHHALSGTAASSLAIPNQESNICINFQKIRPEPTRQIVAKFLRSAGWSKCKKCKQPLPPKRLKKGSQPNLVDWWRENRQKGKMTSLYQTFASAAINEGDIGPFVTDLVERLSDLGNETLKQRFGKGARDYISRLHELARFNIEDEQVKPETRRAFAINRLVRAWMPLSERAVEEQNELRNIRRTIGYVIEAMPWKFSTWRSAVRAASRRPLNPESCDHSDSATAIEWLESQLRRICSYYDEEAPKGWLAVWPDEDDGGKHFVEWKKPIGGACTSLS